MKRRDVFKLGAAALATLGLGTLAGKQPPARAESGWLDVEPERITVICLTPTGEVWRSFEYSREQFVAQFFHTAIQQPEEPLTL
jgi:hypothetical protein